jgi:hypothetical protein
MVRVEDLDQDTQDLVRLIARARRRAEQKQTTDEAAGGGTTPAAGEPARKDGRR